MSFLIKRQNYELNWPHQLDWQQSVPQATLPSHWQFFEYAIYNQQANTLLINDRYQDITEIKEQIHICTDFLTASSWSAVYGFADSVAPCAGASASFPWARCLIVGPSPFTGPPFSSGGLPFCANDSNKSVKKVEPCYSGTPPETAFELLNSLAAWANS